MQGVSVPFWKEKNIGTGYLYFYVHFITEVCCFYALSRVTGNMVILWLTPLIYDFFAFVPQALFGMLCDRFPKFRPGIVGVFVLVAGMLSFSFINNPHISVIIVSIGNALLHVSGAEVTLRTCGKNLSHSALFVSGGSFGVVTGRLLGKTTVPMFAVCIVALTMIPFIMLADTYDKEKDVFDFDFASPKVKPMTVIVMATLIVTVRSYMGYGIPTSWNTTTMQMIFLYMAMGIGKGLGGILCDAIGMYKVAILTIVGALPFLLAGDNIMMVSLVGIMLFSMTMPITLGLIASKLPKNPGLAFGFTTIGLFVGAIPTFIIRIRAFWLSAVVISSLTVVCLILAMYIIKRDTKS